MPTDPPSPGSARAPERIVIDDLGRFGDTAGAFWIARERLIAVGGTFTAAARNAGHALGDPHAAGQYGETFRQMERALDVIEGCFEQFFYALSAARNSYQRAEDSVDGHMR